MASPQRPTDPRERVLDVRGAAEHNLRDVDVTFGPGLTAVVGVSGSGKSSLAFDTVYNEARRRFMETLALGSPWMRVPAARVRRIDGLGPAVSIAQNVLNRNPNSTVATAVGAHPFLRILYARFAAVACPRCDVPVRAVSKEERLRVALQELEAQDGRLDVQVAVVRDMPGDHALLLDGLREVVDEVVVDGESWSGEALDADAPHTIVAGAAHLQAGASAGEVRAALERADGLGSAELLLNGRPVLRAPVCPSCGALVPHLDPAAFSPGGEQDTSSHRVAGRTLDEVLALDVAAAAGFVGELDDSGGVARIRQELVRRLEPLVELGLSHLTLDRPMPTLSRGESQRVRLAVVLSGRLEDLLHVLDEPTIGLHAADRKRLLDAIASLPGPVLMVEHDADAVAMADDVVEIGPGGGTSGGRLVFQGPPARLWASGTVSGDGFSAGVRRLRDRREAGDERIAIVGAHARNLRGIDCEFPTGLLTVVTGPSGAGKTTLVRDVLLASLHDGAAAGCEDFDAPKVRALVVDQSPLGNNPRSNPATYTKVFDRIRKLFADATGGSVSQFTFNRKEGACADCEGMGAIEVKLPFVAPAWIECEACGGSRYRPDALDLEWDGLTIADVLDMSVEEARELFAKDRATARILDQLIEVGLGYVHLGQPSPSLSGGEAQRVRLARELTKAKSGDLIVLDEPTTGLHPADLGRLVGVLDRLTAKGCTVVVVEHQPDVVESADWVVDLGPGGGPDGGDVLHCGPPMVRRHRPARPRKAPRKRPRAQAAIRVRGASAHNLQSVDVDFRKGVLTAVTGVSGSGKSSLVDDVLAAEATRRLLECLSVYERQSAREGPEAPVESISGLGPTLVVDSARQAWGPRATVGGASELDRLVGLVLSRAGERACLECGGAMRRTSPAQDAPSTCEACGAAGVPVEPRHLMGAAANAVCPGCTGLGERRRIVESKLIVRPQEPICGRCMHSPGYYPRNYLCDEGTGGNGSLMAFARRHNFDPYTTPYEDLPRDVQLKFVYGDPEPFQFDRTKPMAVAWGAGAGRVWYWRGAVGAMHDIGGQYSVAEPCDTCGGKRLRPEFLSVRLGGFDRGDLFAMPLADLHHALEPVAPTDPVAAEAHATALRRLRFLQGVGLGYLHLDRATWTLSAGEAQRVKLASVLGGGLLGMTILLDEPSRGLHPREVAALAGTLQDLRSAGNTVVVVEHDPVLISAADEVVQVGPGPGRHGGRIVATGRPPGHEAPAARGTRPRREPTGVMRVVGAAENNLRGRDVEIPLGVLAGVCGVSGSGKSSLVVDTIGLALCPPKMTTGVAYRERVEPGIHQRIEGAPKRTIVADQSRASITSAGAHLGLIDAVRAAFADTDEAIAAELAVKDLARGCDGCGGRGAWRERMGFLPPVARDCDACGGTGYRHEAAALRVRGLTLPEIEALTIDELAADWSDIPAIARGCDAARRLGLGYLVVRQPGFSLSGGEAQRLKLARELSKKTSSPALYLMDEPTVGLHTSDVAVLADTLHEVVEAGNSVLVVEHNTQLLAACDRLIEFGPGAGPDGGAVIFEGTPEQLAAAGTATSPYMAEALS